MLDPLVADPPVDNHGQPCFCCCIANFEKPITNLMTSSGLFKAVGDILKICDYKDK